jgi:hypothetical protein
MHTIIPSNTSKKPSVEKKMIVVTHVQDQAVWIEYMRMYNYDYQGVERAKNEYEEHCDRGDECFYYDCDVFILDADIADKKFEELDKGTAWDVYEFMRLNNGVDIDDLVCE